jgi:hypothetical protein
MTRQSAEEPLGILGVNDAVPASCFVSETVFEAFAPLCLKTSDYDVAYSHMIAIAAW